MLDLAKKSDLLNIAEDYKLPNVKRSMLKQEIKNNLIQFFFDEEIFLFLGYISDSSHPN